MKLHINAGAARTLLLLSAVIALPGVQNIARAQADAPTVASGPEQKVAPRFELTARAESSLIQAGQPVSIKIELKSNVNSDGYVTISKPEMDFQVEVKTERGKMVSPTVYRAEMLQQMVPHRRFVKMQKGQIIQSSLLLNRVVDLSVAGTYAIVVKQGVPKADIKEITQRNQKFVNKVGGTVFWEMKHPLEPMFDTIESNPITITIVEPEVKTVVTTPASSQATVPNITIPQDK